MISESELQFSCVHANGPGGQGVNTSSSAVQLRFDVKNSPSLSAEIKERLLRLAGSRATADGEVVILATEFRSQLRNREAARARLQELLDQAATPPKPRRPTKCPRSQKLLRLRAKRIRSERKRNRRPPTGED
ncbi:MAG: aminoacyl-tRNA hydrolase [Victivallales bacterium]|nr:aminoacyl-tRNA hydrolase [Victivallales bacterium]